MPDKVKKTEKKVKSVHTVTDPISAPIKKVHRRFLRYFPKFILYPLELIIILFINSALLLPVRLLNDLIISYYNSPVKVFRSIVAFTFLCVI